MSTRWTEIETLIRDYENKAWRPVIWAYGSIGVMAVTMVATNNVLLGLLPLVVGVTVAILQSTSGVRCPSCGATIQHGSHGNAGALMLLVNLRQCPYCQTKFE